MTNDNIKSYLELIVNHVITNEDLYPSHLDKSVIKGISIHFGENVNEYLFKNGLLGLCLKEKGLVDEWKNTKLYDILISIKAMECTAERNSINADTVLKSIITHEFMHAVSVGFAGDNTDEYEKDEQYTDYFAKEVFEALNASEKYYSPYILISKIEETNRYAYFKGL